MNQGALTLLDVSAFPSGGLAMPDPNPRGGVFGPQGYGGGIFDGMSGLEGKIVGVSGGGWTRDALWPAGVPMGAVESSDIRAWQGLVNVELRQRGRQVIPVSGVVDPATCGATLWVTNLYNDGQPIYAQLADALDAGTGMAIAEECSSIPQPWPSPKYLLTSAHMVVYGAITAVAAAAGLMILKRRR